jgi:hypothetical protein
MPSNSKPNAKKQTPKATPAEPVVEQQVAAPAQPVVEQPVQSSEPVQTGGSKKGKKRAAQEAAPAEAAPVEAVPAPVVAEEAAPAQAAGGKRAKRTASATPAAKKAPAKKAAAKKAAPKKAAPKKAAPKKAAPKKQADSGDDSEDAGDGKRSFKALLPGSDQFEGRYTGLTPYQAANKALSKYFREAGDAAQADITFSIRESTRGSKRTVYTYNGRREKLATPVEYTIKGKDGERTVVKEYKNRLTKVKKADVPAPVATA